MSLQNWIKSFQPDHKNNGTPLEFYFTGSGTGESTLLNLNRDYVALFDIFGTEPPSKDILESLNIKEISYFQISHLHFDHFYGANSLFSRNSVLSFGKSASLLEQFCKIVSANLKNTVNLSPDQDLSAIFKTAQSHLANKGVLAQKSINSSSLIYESPNASQPLKITALAPIPQTDAKLQNRLEKIVLKIKEQGSSVATDTLVKDLATNINQTSIVNKIEYGNNLILLTGDSDKNVLSNFSLNDIDSNMSRFENLIVKIPHHGSKTSDAKFFFDKNLLSIKNKIAVVSPFDHHSLPHKDVLQKYLDSGYRIFRTSSDNQTISTFPENKKKDSGIVRLVLYPNGQIEFYLFGNAVEVLPKRQK